MGSGTLNRFPILDRPAPGIVGATHPRDFSEGQKPALVLAIQLTAAPRILLLDEPTRGLDYRAKTRLIAMVDELAAEGRSVVIFTHDVEFAARAADVASPVFAPQVAKILSPLPYLTKDLKDLTERSAGAIRIAPRAGVVFAMAAFLGLVAFF